MFSGNEWLIIVALLGLVALVVWLIVRSVRGSGTASVSHARVRGNAADVLSDLQLASSGVSGTLVRRETPESLTAEWTYIPGWAFVVAVLAFPLGLVALITRTSVVGTVIVGQESGGVALMRMGGVFNKATARAINSVIESRS